MKNKIIIAIVSILVIVGIVIGIVAAVSGGNNGLKNNPNLTDAVIGNGKSVVQKGDYLYFINGLSTKSGLTAGQNDWGDTDIFGAIYRTKLNSENQPEYDEDGFLKNVELVIPKLVGYENGGFYIFGNYIYYSSPNNNVDSKGNSLINRTDYFRANLNGTGEKLLYTSATENLTRDDWKIYEVSGNHYLIVKDGSDIISIKANDEVGSVVKMATNVSSVAFLDTLNFYNNQQPVLEKYTNYIYYTRNIKDGETSPQGGNILARVKVNTNQEEIVYSADKDTYTLKAIKNNSIYYTIKIADTDIWFRNEILEDGTLRYSRNESDTNGHIRLSNKSYGEIYIVTSTTSNIGNYLFVKDGSQLLLINGYNAPVVLNDDELKVLAFENETAVLYNTADSKLYTLNVKDTNPELKEINLNGKSIKHDATTPMVEFDGRNVYLYVAYTAEEGEAQNYYLNKLDLNDTNPTLKFVGKFKTEHLPAKPDNADKPEDEHEIWIK